MPRKPIGDHAMTPAERQQRYRDKLKALRAAAPAADPVRNFLTQHPDAVAAGICTLLDAGMARDIDLALRRHLWQNGNRAEWQPSPRATRRTNNTWMRV